MAIGSWKSFGRDSEDDIVLRVLCARHQQNA